MKKITMNVERSGRNGTYQDGEKVFYRISRWITVKQNYHPNKSNSLYYYAMDGYGRKTSDENCDKSELYLDYFTFNGRNYAIEQFWRLGNPFYMPVAYSYQENGKTHYLSAVDMDGDLYHPIYIECDAYCEKVRVYAESY